jgi:DNA-directed RNA polymerase specialized sigma24 family protein
MHTIITMFEQGFSLADIAEKVGKTEKEVKVILHYTMR